MSETDQNAPTVGDLGEWSSYTSSPQESLDAFDTARAKCPVAFSHGHDGFFIPLTYDTVLEVDRTHETYSVAPQLFRPILDRPPILAVEMDPPEHGIWRAVFSKIVNGRTPKRMEGFVRHETARRIENFVERGHCDIVQELSATVPALAICHLMGIDDQEVALTIQRTSSAMFAAQGDPVEYARETQIFKEVAMAEFHDRLVSPRDDILTELTTMEVDGRTLTEVDHFSLLNAILGAGHHSTTSGTTSAIYEVFSDPALRDRLINEPDKISAVIEEALRLHPPFFGFFRRTTAETTLGGTAIPAQADVYMNFGAANRDPAAFGCPHKVDIDRPSLRKHLTFGAGIHTCLGSPLARMEIRVMLEELLARVPDMRVDGDVAYVFDAGEYQHIPSLPVSFSARPPREVVAEAITD